MGCPFCYASAVLVNAAGVVYGPPKLSDTEYCDAIQGHNNDRRDEAGAAVNLNFSVGVGGDNGPADVMLVQTMFHLPCARKR
jgi:hypothetical protein